MRIRWIFSSCIAISLFLSTATRVLADGFIIPEPPVCNRIPCQPLIIPLSQSPLAVKEHIVTVSIKDQLAITHIDQVFINTGNDTVEGTYIFPLPEDAIVQQFTLWINGKPVDGTVLSAEDARRTYEEIVHSMRDPALLEYAGRGAFKASIFPIPAHGEQHVKLEYSQILKSENGLVSYTYPLNTEKFSAEPLEKVSVTVELETSEPIRAVYSPSHSIEVNKDGRFSASAGYEDSDVLPDSDFSLYYSYGETEAIHLLTYRDGRDPSDPDGYFLLMAAPTPDEEAARVDKDILLVLDRSGSMEGEKIRQARSAAQYILSHLSENDRFHITTFSSSVNHFSDGMSPATDAKKAIKWIDGTSAGGSTDINRALLEALDAADKERPTYLIFMTDGQPTVGVRDANQIFKNVTGEMRSNIRLFSFGVGYDVDTILLDTLSQENHGTSTYVKPDDALDQALSVFYEKISTPVLTDLELEIHGVSVYDINPLPLPDLFQGSQLLITGRYRNGGNAEIILNGKTNNEPKNFRFPRMYFVEESSSYPSPESNLPRIWAARKIGLLLNQIRLEGNDRETIEQIVKLSIRYGIVTPYTSYLVTEPVVLGESEQNQLSVETFNNLQDSPSPAKSGAAAVQKAQEQNELSQSIAAPSIRHDDGQVLKIIGSRTFILEDELWVDTIYDPEKMSVKKVKFLSDEYFELLSSRSDLAACFALGNRVLVVDQGKAIEIIE